MAKWLIDKAFNFCYGHRVHTQFLHDKLSENSPCACRHLHGHEGYLRIFLEGEELDSQGMITDFKNLSWLKTFIDKFLDHKFIIDRNDPLYEKMLGEYGKKLKDCPITEKLQKAIIESDKNLSPKFRNLWSVYLKSKESDYHHSGQVAKVEPDKDGIIHFGDNIEMSVNDKDHPIYICKAPMVFVTAGAEYSAGWSIDLSNSGLKGPEYEYYEGFFIVNFTPTSESLAKWMFDLVTAKMNESLGDGWGKVAKVEWFETPKSRAAYICE